MECFVDIEILPDPEVAPHQLLGALFAKVHRGLATGNATGIGVCFPDYQIHPASLGTRLRLLGGSPAL